MSEEGETDDASESGTNVPLNMTPSIILRLLMSERREPAGVNCPVQVRRSETHRKNGKMCEEERGKQQQPCNACYTQESTHLGFSK